MPASALAACAAPRRGGCGVHVAGTSYRARAFLGSGCTRGQRRGLEAQQHAAQAAAEPRIKKAFEQVADNWFTLAEQLQWLEQYGRSQYGRPTPKEPE